jgi:hypothetical protein
MKYTPKFFKDSMPEWKRKKDPLICRCFYRPISFAVSALCTNLGISANSVSYFSAGVAIIGSAMLAWSNYVVNVWGAILINIWLLLDCVDGNIARSVKKQPFGEFADALSSYILVGVMCSCIGINVFINGGLFTEKNNVLLLVIGILASESDTMMRLTHQKYLNTERELMDNGVIKEASKSLDGGHHGNRLNHIQEMLGVGGDLPLFILLATIFHALDLIVIYCGVFYIGMGFVAILIYVRKAIRSAGSSDCK